MAALQIIERDILIKTLLESEAITDLVDNRIMWEFVSRLGKITYPYIRLNLKYGGYTNVTNTRESKSTWQITGLTDDNLDDAEMLLNAIHDTLHDRPPVIPDKYRNELLTYYTILEEQSIFRSFKYHNEPIFDVGGLYCIRLALCEV